MKNKKLFDKGFTLLELLVVVLIIGILAAIALPQYRRAVFRSHLHTGISFLSTLIEAEQAYYIAHGEYTSDLDALDVTIPVSDSCSKWDADGTDSGWDCPWGGIQLSGIGIDPSVMFLYPVHTPPTSTSLVIYRYQITDSGYITRFTGEEKSAGTRWCIARSSSKLAVDVCQGMGEYKEGIKNGVWKFYKIP